MMINNPIQINYTDEKLRILVEEFISQQKNEFTLNGLCSYILYCAMEDGEAVQQGRTLFEGAAINRNDQLRISGILDTIVSDGRVTKAAENYQILNS